MAISVLLMKRFESVIFGGHSRPLNFVVKSSPQSSDFFVFKLPKFLLDVICLNDVDDDNNNFCERNKKLMFLLELHKILRIARLLSPVFASFKALFDFKRIIIELLKNSLYF